VKVVVRGRVASARGVGARALGVLAAALLGALAFGASTASARDGYVTSFDGTKIVYHFYPVPGLAAGQKRPTVMNGPGYSGGGASESDGTVKALQKAGYNVLTWDPRGFGSSGGNVEIDSPDYEARDASALIDYLAKQPEVELDKPGDPHLGMAGGSYGGGIQWVTAATDSRVDVITPSISWNSLITSLDKNDTAKGGWGSVLFGGGVEGSAQPGTPGNPAGFQFGRMQDPQARDALVAGLATGRFSDSAKAFFGARGPNQLLKRIRIPTLITQGTSDTLFTLHESIENYRAVRANGVPLKMLWFCGGLTAGSTAHGICQTPMGSDPDPVKTATLRWLDRYLKGDKRVDTGPRFEWISDTGARHSGDDYPLPQGPPLVGTSSGTLALIPGSVSGALIAAAPAATALNVALPKVGKAANLLGEPTLTIRYSGVAPQPADGRIYAQLVDNRRNQVVGPVVTPVPVDLDGSRHTLTVPLEAVALDATPQSSYSLQLTDGSDLYFAQRQAGTVNFDSVRVSIPSVVPGPHADADGCVNSRGGASGKRLGPAVLGRTRAKQRKVFRGNRLRSRGGIDRYCATGGGTFRMGYPSRRLNHGVERSTRRRISGRTVLALTTSKRYSVRGIKRGTTVRTLRRRLRGEHRIRVGANTWYVAAGHSTRLVFRTRGKRVYEVGIGDKRLTGSIKGDKHFLRAWQLGGR
jgi:ABC-2 type transport system ATP-binding protein